MKFYKKLLVLCALALIPTSSILANTQSDYKTVLDQESMVNSKIFPSDKYNIKLMVNKETEEEVYTYYDRKEGTSVTYVIKNGETVRKTESDEILHPYSLLYKEGTNIVSPDIENVYFSYVTLTGNIDYIYQVDTGKLAYMNCAPTSIAMAYNWANDLDKNTGLTAGFIRSTYPSSEEGDVDDMDYKSGYTITQMAEIYKDLGMDIYESSSYTNSETLISWLNKGYLLNLAVDSEDLTYEPDKTSRINKSYRGGGGHSIICTGYLYVIVENPKTGESRETLYFEIVDPAEGKDNKVRYYTKESMNKMLLNNYCRYIAVKHS